MNNKSTHNWPHTREDHVDVSESETQMPPVVLGMYLQDCVGNLIPMHMAQPAFDALHWEKVDAATIRPSIYNSRSVLNGIYLLDSQGNLVPENEATHPTFTREDLLKVALAHRGDVTIEGTRRTLNQIINAARERQRGSLLSDFIKPSSEENC